MRVCNGSGRQPQKRELRGMLNVEASQTSVVNALDKIAGQEDSTIAALPSGVLAHIFEGLGPRDLASASCVCRSWRHLVALEAAANLVWRSFYSARWQLSGVQWPKLPSPQRLRPLQSQTDALAVPCASSHLSSSSPSPPSSLSCSPLEMRWQWAYGSKMLRLRSWSGRYSADQVVGHKSAVRAVRLLPSLSLLATASLDCTVRLWDLAAGMPLACSRPHGGTVRCLGLDTCVLASGCSDNLVRVWHRRRDPDTTALPLYDISSKPYLLRGHTGPVSCLALDELNPSLGAVGGQRDGLHGGNVGGGGTIFSGSWDCTVRIWRRGLTDGGYDEDESDDADGFAAISDDVEGSDGSSGRRTGDEGRSSGGTGSGGSAAAPAAAVPRRGQRHRSDAGEAGGWSCAGVLQYGDWVYCCAVRGGNLLVAAGSEVVVTDAVTGRAVRRFAGLHDGGAVACLEGCRSGRLLFTASADGLLLAHDLRMKQGSRVLWHHKAAVTGLSFEDPWLASSSADGCIILQDSEQALAGGCSPQRPLSSSCRALHCPTSQPALSLDLSDQWLAAGTDSGVVRLWDFTGAAAAAERAAAARAARGAARAARLGPHQHQQQHQHQQHAPLPPPPPRLHHHQLQHQEPPPNQQQYQHRRLKQHGQCWLPMCAGAPADSAAGEAATGGCDTMPEGSAAAGGAGGAGAASGSATGWAADRMTEEAGAGAPMPKGGRLQQQSVGSAEEAPAAAAGAGGLRSHRQRRRGSGGHPGQSSQVHTHHHQSHHHHVSRTRGGSTIAAAFRYVGTAAAAVGLQQAPPPPLPPPPR